jgi:hypothetical protein
VDFRAAKPSQDEQRSEELLEAKRENVKLRSELRRVEEERDILEKAAVHSIGECNIIRSIPTQGDVAIGSDGTTRTFRVTEGGSMATMEERPVA